MSLIQHSSIVEDYPDSYYIINAGYPSLFSHEERSALRTRASNSTGGERYIVENPVYTKNPKSKDRFLGFKRTSLVKLYYIDLLFFHSFVYILLYFTHVHVHIC